MPHTVTIEQLTAHRDARGCVCEPLSPDLIPGQKNVHIVVSEPGAVRGNHYHLRGTEVLIVLGPSLVRIKQDGKTMDTHVPAGEIYRFTVPPGITHAVQNTGSAASVGLAFNSEVHDPSAPDLVRDIIIEP